jgi:hypothetical protein
VPRYTPFTPGECPSPYAVEVVLMEIACQHCHRRFQVELHNGPVGDASRLAKEVKSGRVNYGDPPHHDCPGDMVNSEPLRIVEFHMRRSGEDWKRDTSFEGAVQPELARH